MFYNTPVQQGRKIASRHVAVANKCFTLVRNIFVGLQHVLRLISAFWRLSFSGGSYIGKCLHPWNRIYEVNAWVDNPGRGGGEWM